MIRRVIYTLLALVVIVVVAVVVSSLGLGPSTRFNPSRAELDSAVPAVQARAALERFFDAVGSGDTALASSLVDSSAAPTEWKVSRIVVESIALDSGQSAPGDLSFFAPIRMWPDDGSFTAGERLDWSWTLRQVRGHWQIVAFGFR